MEEVKILFTKEGREEIVRRLPHLLADEEGFFEKVGSGRITDARALAEVIMGHTESTLKKFIPPPTEKESAHA